MSISEPAMWLFCNQYIFELFVCLLCWFWWFYRPATFCIKFWWPCRFYWPWHRYSHLCSPECFHD